MKNSISNYYKWFVIGIWTAIGLTGFIQFMNDSCPFLESLLYLLCFLIAGISISTFLSVRLFPKALNAGNMRLFSLQFTLSTLLLALALASATKGFVWLEKQGIFAPSLPFLELERPFYIEFLTNLLSAFAINFRFKPI